MYQRHFDFNSCCETNTNTLRYQTILEEIVIMLDNPILFHTNIGTTRTWDDSSLL